VTDFSMDLATYVGAVGQSARGRRRLAGTLVAAAIVLTSCFGQDADLAARAVDQFHDQLNAGQFHDIYSQSSEEFRNATKESDWTALLGAVQRKLGKVTSSKQTSVNVSTGTFGTAVNQSYATQFANGTGTENFSWAIRGGKAVLVGYRIDSAQLVTQ
jgi:hypothetical protein